MPMQSPPATKEDVRLLMEMLGATRREIIEAEDRTKRHFDVVVEDIRHDLLGANHDKLSVHDQKLNEHDGRLQRVERQIGFAPAS